MNPLGVLSAVVALAVFPGAAFAGVTSLVSTWAGRLPAATGPTPLGGAAAAAGVVAGCGLLALPGSPLSNLPAGASLAGLVVLLAAGLAWGTSDDWPWRRVAAAAATLLPFLAMAAATGTLDIPSLAAAPLEPARIAATGAALLALPALVRPFDPSAPRASRGALLGALPLVVTSFATSAPLAALPAALVAAICALSAIAYAGLIGLMRRPLSARAPLLGLLAALPAAAAIALALA